jgi:hypothetical protein
VVGRPVYHTGDTGHRAYAETVGAAVRGARVALARADRGRRTVGPARYVDRHATGADRNDWGTG